MCSWQLEFHKFSIVNLVTCNSGRLALQPADFILINCVQANAKRTMATLGNRMDASERRLPEVVKSTSFGHTLYLRLGLTY